jgi:S1-C subfamily serine protease
MYSFLLLAAVPGQFAESKDFPSELQRRAFEATVYCYHPASRSTGTAVVIGNRDGKSFLLTAAHVVPESRIAGREKEDVNTVELYRYSASNPDRGSSGTNARVMARMPNPDLAVIAVEWKGPPTAIPLYPAIRMELIALKPPFPVMTLGARDGPPVIQFDVVSDRKYVTKPDGTEGIYWQANTPQQLGRSGGPMIDKGGRVIGIASGKQHGKGYYANIDEIHRALIDGGFEWLVPRPMRPAGSQKNSG